jgi:MFS transporter, DHA1 family, multidrug resistance protein
MHGQRASPLGVDPPALGQLNLPHSAEEKAGAAEINSSEHRGTIALYAAAVFLFWFSQYIYVPTLPTFVQSKTTDLAVVGVVLSMYGLWQAIIRLPLGLATDWVGWRKPFILGGIACSGIGAWIMVTSRGVEGLAFGRAVTGLAAGSWVPLVVAFTALFPPQEAVRASALLVLFNSLGRLAATTLAGPLGAISGYSSTFYIAMGVSALSVFTLLPIREVPRLSNAPLSASVRRLIVRHDVLLPSALSAVAQYVNWAISFGFLAVLVQQLGGDTVAQGAVVTVLLVMTVLGNLLASSLVSRFGSQHLVYASFLFIAFGTVWAALSHDLPVLFIAPAFLGIGSGIAGPVLMGLSIENVAGTERTIAMGLHQTIYAIGMFAGPALSGAIASALGIQTMFALTALMCLAIGFLGTSFLGTVGLVRNEDGQ